MKKCTLNMKNKRTHIILIISSIVIALVLIGLIIYGYIAKIEELTIMSILIDFVIILWFGTYPISFYTCWRIVSVEERDYNGFVSRLIYATKSGNIFGLVFTIPLIYSPLFIVLYVKVFKKDLQHN